MDPLALVINVLQSGGFRRTIEAFLTECQEKYADGSAPVGSLVSPGSPTAQPQLKADYVEGDEPGESPERFVTQFAVLL